MIEEEKIFLCEGLFATMYTVKLSTKTKKPLAAITIRKN
jgi:hypothetical protein